MKKMSIALLLSMITATTQAADATASIKNQLTTAGVLVLSAAGADRVGQLSQNVLGEKGAWMAAGIGAMVIFDDAGEALAQPNKITENMPLGLGKNPFLINASLAAGLTYGTRLAVQNLSGVTDGTVTEFYKNVVTGVGVLVGLNKVYGFLSARAKKANEQVKN